VFPEQELADSKNFCSQDVALNRHPAIGRACGGYRGLPATKEASGLRFHCDVDSLYFAIRLWLILPRFSAASDR
jgi:hypothetical protein